MIHITVCICTFKRPELLKRILAALLLQETAGKFTFSIVVSDNDRGQSAKSIVCSFDQKQVPILYAVEPEQNIAAARNKALEYATGDFIAFIDDDEFPCTGWLLQMLQTCQKYQASGSLGPVLPLFEEKPPKWLVKGRFCERPRYKTGSVLAWRNTRTGNVLINRKILDGNQQPFRREYGSGGEDQEFFKRMMERGSVFVWCDEAPVHEVVPPARWRRRYLLKRALLRGQNEKGLTDICGVGKSLVALPAYTLMLPILLLLGHHLFMKYLVKSLDHAGKLLSMLGVRTLENKYLTQ
jgi:succinoglycan biosynthesis protein ExoM